MSKESLLAQIADFYTPLLLLLALILCVKSGFKLLLPRLALLMVSALWVYGLMYVDGYGHIWGGLGGDYSTHTAVSLALVLFCGKLLQTRLAWVLLSTSLLAYGEVMFYLGYHSWADMLSTAVVVALGLWVIYDRLAPKIKFN
jgi:hypothetical protein